MTPATDMTPAQLLRRRRFEAARAIDAAAGRARLRYITEVPGQQAVYVVKLEQARSYLLAVSANPGAAPPPYIAAEASALGRPAAEVAQSVVTLATLWNEVKGPQIEGLRIGAKAAVMAPDSSFEAVVELERQALEALSAV